MEPHSSGGDHPTNNRGVSVEEVTDEQRLQEHSRHEQSGEYKQCFVALIRHGERADAAPFSKTSKVYKYEHDPPLTDRGIKQAEETGVALKKFLMEEQKYDEIIIETSPFIRTMMTAAGIARGLGHSKIRINYLYSEILQPHMFERCPLAETCLRKLDKKVVVEKYLDGIDFEDSTTFKAEIENAFPENKIKGAQRTQLML